MKLNNKKALSIVAYVHICNINIRNGNAKIKHCFIIDELHGQGLLMTNKICSDIDKGSDILKGGNSGVCNSAFVLHEYVCLVSSTMFCLDVREYLGDVTTCGASSLQVMSKCTVLLSRVRQHICIHASHVTRPIWRRWGDRRDF